MGKHYVDNKRLYAVLVQYKKDRTKAEKANKPIPPNPMHRTKKRGTTPLNQREPNGDKTER